jgi:hypothetical protein
MERSGQQSGMMMGTDVCSSRMLSLPRYKSGGEELTVFPRHTKVIPICNNRIGQSLSWWPAYRELLRRLLFLRADTGKSSSQLGLFYILPRLFLVAGSVS